MVSYAKYSLVPTEEPKDKTEQKLVSSTFDYSSAFNYKSAFEYNSNNSSQYQSAFDYGYGPKHSVSLGIGEKDKKKKRKNFSIMDCITAFVTGVSYFFIAITFPCTLWFCIKRLKQWERLIVFRIGRLRGVLGPGLVFVVPWIDRFTRVDMRTKAFSVPPQQLITVDNGIIEMGCEVKYRVSDVQQLTTSVITPQHGLRSFGKTVMLNVLTKHTVREMERDRLLIAAEILKELNTRVANWGIEIGQVDLSTVNVLKEPEPNNPLKPLLSALGNNNSSNPGVDGLSSMPSPPSGTLLNAIPPVAPISKGSSSLLDFSTLAKISGLGGLQGFSISGPEKKKPKPEVPGHDKMNSDLIQLLDETKVTSTATQSNLFSKHLLLQQQQLKDNKVTMGGSSVKTKLGRYLQGLVEGPGGADLSNGVYRLQIEGKDAGVYIIFITSGIRQVVEGDLPKIVPDVSVVISKEDLTSVLEGTLPPLQAYLSGRLTVTGNIQLLMGLESLRQANCAITSEQPDDIFVV